MQYNNMFNFKKLFKQFANHHPVRLYSSEVQQGKLLSILCCPREHHLGTRRLLSRARQKSTGFLSACNRKVGVASSILARGFLRSKKTLVIQKSSDFCLSLEAFGE
jgi:hypothetical protein